MVNTWNDGLPDEKQYNVWKLYCLYWEGANKSDPGWYVERWIRLMPSVLRYEEQLNSGEEQLNLTEHWTRRGIEYYRLLKLNKL